MVSEVRLAEPLGVEVFPVSVTETDPALLLPVIAAPVQLRVLPDCVQEIGAGKLEPVSI